MTSSTDGVLVIMPAFNEQASVGSVVTDVRREGYPVVVVDDGSTDRTADAATGAGAEVLRLPFNLGVGGALRAGFRLAQTRGFEIVVQVDADGQHDPREISPLVMQLRAGGLDMVVGSRFADGSDAYAVGRWRRLAMSTLSRRATRATGVELSDATSGFRVIGPRLLERFAHNYPVEYLGDTVEALVIAGESGSRIAERPVHMHDRSAGVASAGPVASAWYVVRVLVAIELMRGRRPDPPPPLPNEIVL